jgi:hypothetical protein
LNLSRFKNSRSILGIAKLPLTDSKMARGGNRDVLIVAFTFIGDRAISGAPVSGFHMRYNQEGNQRPREESQTVLSTQQVFRSALRT